MLLNIESPSKARMNFLVPFSLFLIKHLQKVMYGDDEYDLVLL
jgi:hypothetical protein